MTFSPTDLVAPSTAVLAFAAAAAVVDARERRIPNRLVVAGIACALVAQIWQGGASALPTAVAGAVVGLAVLLPFHLVGAMGAGDVKLMAMVGTGLGPKGTLGAVVLTFLIGGALALGIAASHGTLGRVLANVRAMLVGTLATFVVERRAEIAAPAESAGHFPYGVAIALGVLAHVLLARTGTSIL